MASQKDLNKQVIPVKKSFSEIAMQWLYGTDYDHELYIDLTKWKIIVYEFLLPGQTLSVNEAF